MYLRTLLTVGALALGASSAQLDNRRGKFSNMSEVQYVLIQIRGIILARRQTNLTESITTLADTTTSDIPVRPEASIAPSSSTASEISSTTPLSLTTTPSSSLGTSLYLIPLHRQI